MRVGPVAFLLLVPLAWAAVRGVMLWPDGRDDPEREIAWAKPLDPRRESDGRVIHIDQSPVTLRAGFAARSTDARRGASGPRQNEPQDAGELLGDILRPAGPPQGRSRSAPPQTAVPTYHHPPQQRDRFSLASWALLRGNDGPGLAAAGQLGGSQAGVRARYAVTGDLHLAARVSGPIRTRLGKEAAIGLDWRPLKTLPITIALERRVGLDRGGRDAWGLGAFGGVDSLSLPLGLRLDGYAQLGLVGINRRDAYVDGVARIERPVFGTGSARIAVGAGVWGGAQPGAARLDIGPQLVARVPIAAGGLRLGAEWRQRVAGEARPGSGPVLSLGADF